MPTFKSPCLFVLPLLLAAVFSWARDMQQPWVQVSSRHFTIICQGNEKQARRIGDQLERMRLVFKTTFPNLQVDPSAPVVVIVVKDQKAFRALEPDDYLVKGGLELTGSFLRAPEKNYVLLRLDAGGNHPYATVYHEYTQLLTSKAEFIPLWLNEGLAEFYENTEVSGTEAVLGQADEGQILWLRQNPLLPLLTLFTVDHNSPYYHQENKGSMFYAESWALTHYLQIKGAKENKNYIRDYLLLVANQVDPVTAAGQALVTSSIFSRHSRLISRNPASTPSS
ncbi:MAG: DUF1570 domain-containing protein [Acidobacteriales bacterium]|nr:DUF1570 domain-containing protein [Terriglobales bacterium]